MKKIIAQCVAFSILVAVCGLAIAGLSEFGRFYHREYRKLTVKGEALVGQIGYETPSAD